VLWFDFDGDDEMKKEEQEKYFSPAGSSSVQTTGPVEFRLTQKRAITIYLASILQKTTPTRPKVQNVIYDHVVHPLYNRLLPPRFFTYGGAAAGV
jgi:hypothetical protein